MPGAEPAAPVGARRRMREEAAAAAAAEPDRSFLDHPATFVVVSVLALVAVVLGLNAALQGAAWALIPGVLLAGAYVVLLRRLRSRR